MLNHTLDEEEFAELVKGGIVHLDGGVKIALADIGLQAIKKAVDVEEYKPQPAPTCPICGTLIDDPDEEYIGHWNEDICGYECGACGQKNIRILSRVIRSYLTQIYEPNDVDDVTE